MQVELTSLLSKLGARAQTGSKPRCHLLTHGTDEEVARRLTQIAQPFAIVHPGDRWMPVGFEEIEECQLHRASRVLDSPLCSELEDWWLAPASSKSLTPNIDIASTCAIEGREGLLLIEAKAHEAELLNEAKGRILDPSTPDRNASHEKIGAAIAQAGAGLTTATGLAFKISRDRGYQMSNRFAWSWKLAASGIPVVLVYLGFVDAQEMPSPLHDHAHWEKLVRSHCDGLAPAEAWERQWSVNGTLFVPLIRSMNQPLAVA